MTANNTKWVRLGDYIEEVDERVGMNTNIVISGININEGFIPTVANMVGVDIHKYKCVPKGCFACNLMHVGRDITIPMAYNSVKENIAVSPAYTVFKVKQENQLIPQYLDLFFCRREVGRLAWFHTIGSIRGNLLYKVFCDILIPLPSIEVQRDLVATYEGLKRLAEDNEALIAPLTEACQAFIVDCKRQYPSVPLGDYIEEVDERNKDLSVKLTQGIDVNMTFIPAKREAEDKEGGKIVRTGQFAYNKVVKSNGTKLPIALRKGEACTISSSYSVFQITKKNLLLTEFLFLLLSRSEFHRYCGYKAEGTTRDVFSFNELSRVQIPLPPLEVQQSIVNLYHCMEEAKSIAREARERLATLCPALVQYAIDSEKAKWLVPLTTCTTL